MNKQITVLLLVFSIGFASKSLAMQYTPDLTIETDAQTRSMVQQEILDLALEKTFAAIKEGALYKYLFTIDGNVENADTEENEDISEYPSTSSSDADDDFYEGIRTPKKTPRAIEYTDNYKERQSHYTNKQILRLLSKNKKSAHSEEEIIAAAICAYYLAYRPYINIQDLWLSALASANHITGSVA